MQPGQRYIQNCFLTVWAKPNHQPKTVFNQYLGQYWVLLQTNFCVESVRSCWLFWVQWKLHSERKEIYKIWPFTSKIVYKMQICGKICANGAKRVFFWVSVSPKELESVEISHSPESLLHSVMAWSDSISVATFYFLFNLAI